MSEMNFPDISFKAGQRHRIAQLVGICFSKKGLYFRHRRRLAIRVKEHNKESKRPGKAIDCSRCTHIFVRTKGNTIRKHSSAIVTIFPPR